jgi:hypothetical protein
VVEGVSVANRSWKGLLQTELRAPQTVTFSGTTYGVSICPLKDEATHGTVVAAASPNDVAKFGLDVVRALPVADAVGFKYVAVHLKDTTYGVDEWRVASATPGTQTTVPNETAGS